MVFAKAIMLEVTSISESACLVDGSLVMRAFIYSRKARLFEMMVNYHPIVCLSASRASVDNSILYWPLDMKISRIAHIISPYNPFERGHTKKNSPPVEARLSFSAGVLYFACPPDYADRNNTIGAAIIGL